MLSGPHRAAAVQSAEDIPCTGAGLICSPPGQAGKGALPHLWWAAGHLGAITLIFKLLNLIYPLGPGSVAHRAHLPLP